MNLRQYIICGDFNINLLNCDSHNDSNTFVETMYGLGLYPLINKPTRITEFSATVIDNIFTNNINNKMNCGILIKDLTDHLPIFTCCEEDIQRKDKVIYKHSRNHNDCNVNKFKL